MSVLDRDALSQSPLADLHVIAGEIGIDGYRRLRKADLVEAIVVRSGGDPLPPEDDDADTGAEATTDTGTDDDDRPARSGRGRRGGRSGGRGRAARDEDSGDDDDRPARGGRAPRADRDRDEDRPARGGRGGRDRDRDDREPRGDREPREEKVVQGEVELLPNGSGFVRLTPGETADGDVYISAAQVKRCELVTGDKVAGPVRAPRRSERYPSLIRVDTINGKSADEVAGEGTKFDDLPASFPDERLPLGGEDPTVTAIEWLTPFGKGSRVVVTGAAHAGKTEALRRIAAALAAQEGLEVSVALAGVRPEEIGDWSAEGLPAPAAAVSFAAGTESQSHAVEQTVEQARRVAARGGDAVVIIDSLEHVPVAAARRILAAARNITDGGSLTVIASLPKPLGGETTVIALDATLTGLGRFPALDLLSSGTMRSERLVGDAGAEAIAKARADALGANG